MAFADSGLAKIVKEAAAKVNIIMAAACQAGDLLGYSSGWKPANESSTTILAELVAGENGAAGDVITAYRMAVVSGSISGAAPGNTVYLDDGGKVSESPGETAVQAVGRSLTDSELLLSPGFPNFIKVEQQAHISDADATVTNSSPYGWDSEAHATTVVTAVNAILDVLEAYGMVATS